MSAQPAVQSTERVRAFLHAARNRFWIAAAIDGARLPLWSMAVTMLILATLHVRVVPVTPVVVVSLVLVFLGVLLVRVGVRRPSLAASALIADRFLDGKSLLTTARECCERGAADRTAACAIVIRQAAAASSDWAARLPRITSRDLVSDLVAPSAIVVVGVVLLAFPGVDPLATRTTPPAAPAKDTVSDSGSPARTEVARLLGDALLTDESAAATSARGSFGGGPEGAPSPVASSDRMSATETRVVERSLRNPLAVSAGSGEQAGQGRPGDTQGIEATDPSIAFAGRETIRIERTGAPSASTRSGAGLYADDGVAVPGATATVAAARPPGEYGGELVTSAQAAYAARYMQQTGKGNDDAGH